MKGGVNSVTGWELELVLVDDLIYQTLNWERIDVSGTQLLARQAEGQIPG